MGTPASAECKSNKRIGYTGSSVVSIWHHNKTVANNVLLIQLFSEHCFTGTNEGRGKDVQSYHIPGFLNTPGVAKLVHI